MLMYVGLALSEHPNLRFGSCELIERSGWSRLPIAVSCAQSSEAGGVSVYAGLFAVLLCEVFSFKLWIFDAVIC